MPCVSADLGLRGKGSVGREFLQFSHCDSSPYIPSLPCAWRLKRMHPLTHAFHRLIHFCPRGCVSSAQAPFPLPAFPPCTFSVYTCKCTCPEFLDVAHRLNYGPAILEVVFVIDRTALCDFSSSVVVRVLFSTTPLTEVFNVKIDSLESDADSLSNWDE